MGSDQRLLGNSSDDWILAKDSRKTLGSCVSGSGVKRLVPGEGGQPVRPSLTAPVQKTPMAAIVADIGDLSRLVHRVM